MEIPKKLVELLRAKVNIFLILRFTLNLLD